MDLGVSLGSLNSFAQSRDHLLLSGKFGQKSETIENLLVISKQEVLSQVRMP